MDDPRTLLLAQRGDRASRDRILRDLQDPWYRFCLGLLHDPDLAVEATQETAVRFLERLAGFRGDSSVRTWSLGIALNVVREMRRKHRRPADDLADTAAIPDGSPAVDSMAMLTEQMRHVRRMLDDLPERQREALVLRYFEDLSVDDTAAAMNCAPGTVKATVHQALRALKRKLDGLK